MALWKITLERRASQFTSWRDWKEVHISARTEDAAYLKAAKIYENPYCRVGKIEKEVR